MARFLAGPPDVGRVDYPGLETHPDHSRARELFSGYGGMLSFELVGGAPAADRMISGLRLIMHAGSLGGLESLVTRPAQVSHVGMTPEERARQGISERAGAYVGGDRRSRGPDRRPWSRALAL